MAVAQLEPNTSHERGTLAADLLKGEEGWRGEHTLEQGWLLRVDGP